MCIEVVHRSLSMVHGDPFFVKAIKKEGKGEEDEKIQNCLKQPKV